MKKIALEDLLFLIALVLIITTTFFLNVYIGCYLLGGSLLVVSFILASKTKEKGGG